MKRLFQTSEKTGIELQWARKLYIALAQHGKASKRSKISLWTKEFKQLKQQHHPQTIATVLDWYCTNLKHCRIKAHSAKSFRLKFDSIEESVTSSDVITLDAATTEFVQSLQLVWPHRTVRLVNQVAATTWTNYTATLTHLRKHASPLAAHLSNVLLPPLDFLKEWLEKQNAAAWAKPAYKIRPLQFGSMQFWWWFVAPQVDGQWDLKDWQHLQEEILSEG